MRLQGVKRVVVCLPPPSNEREAAVRKAQMRAFAVEWRKAIGTLRRRGMERLPRGITVVCTNARQFYARFWSDDIMCVNLAASLQKGGREIILHELAHRVWFRLMSKHTRTAWAIDHHARRRAQRALPSGYSAEGPIEDHAESFRLRCDRKLRGASLVRYLRLGPVSREVRRRLSQKKISRRKAA